MYSDCGRQIYLRKYENVLYTDINLGDIKLQKIF